MAIDLSIFELRTMLPALEEILPPKTAIKDAFFPDATPSMTETIDIHVYKGKRRLAAYVLPQEEGKVVERVGYTAKSFTMPYTKQKIPYTAQDVLRTPLGAHIYAPNAAPNARAMAALGKDLATLQDMIVRLYELRAVEAIDTGKATILGDSVDAEIDFLKAADHNKVNLLTDRWTDTTNSDPVADLRGWKKKVRQDSGLNCNRVYMGEDVTAALILHPKVIEVLDNRRKEFGIMKPEVRDDGTEFIMNLLEMDFYQYDEWYIDPTSGLEVPMLAANRLLMGSTNVRAATEYAAIQDLDVTAAVKMFPKSWRTDDPSVQWIMLQSAGQPVPHQIDGFFTATPI